MRSIPRRDRDLQKVVSRPVSRPRPILSTTTLPCTTVQWQGSGNWMYNLADGTQQAQNVLTMLLPCNGKVIESTKHSSCVVRTFGVSGEAQFPNHYAACLSQNWAYIPKLDHIYWSKKLLLMRLRMVSWGISSQTWIRASMSSWTVCGTTWQRRMHRYITSQRFSTGFKSGDREGQSMALMPSSFRNCLHTQATWGQALSCTRRNPGPTAPG